MALPSAQSRSRALGPLLLAVWWLCVRVPPAMAQGGERLHYSKETVFKIPFQLDGGGRGVKQVLLHVSEDSGQTYELVHSVAPTEQGFQFTAKRDGWYWFAVQTQDTAGRLYPPNLNLVQPGLKVCVDTQQPVIKTFKVVHPREGTAAVEWEVQDENLDLMSLTLHYRPVGGRDWTRLEVRPLQLAQYGWTPAASGPCEVRLGISDKARNYSEKIITLTPLAGGAAAPGASGGSEPGRVPVIHVRNRRFQLEYSIENVGPSAVKNVEVWVTTDTRSWQRHSMAPAAGPYTLEVRAEGRYGFTLIPRSGVGLAQKLPEPGDQPQVWVQVDETRPVIKLLNVVVTREQPDQMTVYWSASDRHLRAQPISILYATAPGGPWTPLKEKLENSGACTLSTKELPYEFYVRVEAVDEAGNVGCDQRKESVKVDLKIPKVGHIGVKPVEAQAGTPPSPP
jgi:hypothetical protein